MLFSFLLISEVKFHETNVKKISMVSVYSWRPVYTFLYTIINGNIIASFVHKKFFFEILWSKKKFFCVRTQLWNPPLPLVRNRTHLAWPSPPPLCVRTMWMTPYLSQTKKYKCSILITLLRNGNFLNQCYGVSPISVFPTLSVILMLLNGWVIEKNMLSIKARNKQTTSFSIKTLAQTLIRLIRLKHC